MTPAASSFEAEPPEPKASAADDRRLLARVATGDEVAFALLMNRHQDRLLGLCERLLGDREAGLDAVQEVFLKVFRKAATFKPRAKVYTWLYRIATNHCLNQLRRRKIVRFIRLQRHPEDEETPFPEPRDEGPNPHQSLEIRQRWRATRRCIDALPESQRAVLILAKFEGLSYRQIAEVLQITESAVESRLVRAMRRLVKS